MMCTAKECTEAGLQAGPAGGPEGDGTVRSVTNQRRGTSRSLASVVDPAKKWATADAAMRDRIGRGVSVGLCVPVLTCP